MDTQTLVNRIEEMRAMSDKMVEISQDKDFNSNIKTEFYQGEWVAFTRLLIWLQDNGVSPDTTQEA